MISFTNIPKEPGIYRLFNEKNGKSYVGQTNNLCNRIQDHFALLKRKRHIHSLQNDYNNDHDFFKYEILEKCDIDMLDEKEIYWIKYFDSTNDEHGYNKESGGKTGSLHSEESSKKRSESMKKAWSDPDMILKQSVSHQGKNHTEETRLKISKAKKGIKLTDECKAKISERMKGKRIGDKHPMYGKHHSDETKRKISEHSSMKNNLELRKKHSQALMGENNPMYGKHHSDETKQKFKLAWARRKKRKILSLKISYRIFLGHIIHY